MTCLLALIAGWPAQGHQGKGAMFASGDGNVKVRFGGFRFRQAGPVNGGPSGELDLTGGVSAASISQGIQITADTASIFLTISGKSTSFRSVQASGGVHLTKVARAPSGSRRSEIRCSKLELRNGNAKSVARLSGPVAIADYDSKGNIDLQASGSSGEAVFLEGRSSAGSPLQSANLSGQVTVRLTQAAGGSGKPGRLTAAAEKVTIDNSAAPTVTLRGHVVIKGVSGGLTGDLSGLPQVVFRLNSKLQVQSIDGGER